MQKTFAAVAACILLASCGTEKPAPVIAAQEPVPTTAPDPIAQQPPEFSIPKKDCAGKPQDDWECSIQRSSADGDPCGSFEAGSKKRSACETDLAAAVSYARWKDAKSAYRQFSEILGEEKVMELARQKKE